MGGHADIFAPVAEIERALDAYIARRALPPNLLDAMRYALMGGGKRLRPLLAWHACAAAGADPRRALAAGAAVEMIHAFSLVHDDLPALDNDDLRRGRPTLHRHAGEAMAILAGDGLLNEALLVALGHDAMLAPPPQITADLARVLAQATAAMIAGQVEDTLGGFPPGSSPHRVEAIHRKKTAALIHASVVMGAISGGLDGDALDPFSTYAQNLGLMFQIVDDLIDVTQSSEAAGKRTGKDAGAGKLTWPVVFGVEVSRRTVDELLDGALAVLAPMGSEAEGLRHLATTLARRDR